MLRRPIEKLIKVNVLWTYKNNSNYRALYANFYLSLFVLIEKVSHEGF